MKILYGIMLLADMPALKTNGSKGEAERSGGIRNIDLYGKQANRISDAISVKRGELVRILNLLQNKTQPSGYC